MTDSGNAQGSNDECCRDHGNRETIRMGEIAPSHSFSTPDGCIADAKQHNKNETVERINRALWGKTLKDFSSALDKVEFDFGDKLLLRILPPSDGNSVRYDLVMEERTDAERLALPKMNDVDVSVKSAVEYEWDAFTVLNNRIGMEFNGVFFNGEWLFTYWKGLKIIAFKGKREISSGKNILYWFDVE